MIVKYSDKYDILTTEYSISAREYFEILRLAMLHVEGKYLETSYEITQHEKSPETYKLACLLLKTMHENKDLEQNERLKKGD